MSDMKSKVTVQCLNRVEGKNGVVGICDLGINSEFMIKGVLVSHREGKYSLKFPYMVRATPAGKEYIDLAHPITADARKIVTEQVLAEAKVKFGEDGLLAKEMEGAIDN